MIHGGFLTCSSGGAPTIAPSRKPYCDVSRKLGDRLLTLREAAEILRLSIRTVRHYVHRGEIEGRIIGGRWRLRREDLDAFFEKAPRNSDFIGKNNHED